MITAAVEKPRAQPAAPEWTVPGQPAELQERPRWGADPAPPQPRL